MLRTNFTVQNPETYFQLNSSKISINYIEKFTQKTFSKKFTTGLKFSFHSTLCSLSYSLSKAENSSHIELNQIYFYMVTTRSQRNSVYISTERLLPYTVGRFTVFHNYENCQDYRNNKFSGFLF